MPGRSLAVGPSGGAPHTPAAPPAAGGDAGGQRWRHFPLPPRAVGLRAGGAAGGRGTPGRRGAGRCSRAGPPRRRAASSSRGLALPARADGTVGGGRGAACGRRGERGRGGRQQPRRSGGCSRRRAGVGLRAALPLGPGQLPQGALRRKPGCSGLSRPPGEARTPEPGTPGAGAPAGLRRQPGSAGSPGRQAGPCGRGSSVVTPGGQFRVVRIRAGRGSRGQAQPRGQAGPLETRTHSIAGLVLD